MEEKKRVLVALSGGVDSSACVHLLQEQGWDVGGIVLKMSPAHEQTVRDAQEAADTLGIQLYVRDMSEAFDQLVVEYFVEEYRRGRTPNPCVVCNPLVKFRALIDAAEEYGFPRVATGHYAALLPRDGKVLLARGEDRRRDQSYMLYRLGQRELTRLIFPLARMGKDAVRTAAQEAGLACAQKPDSQEICFIPDHDYAGYIAARTGEAPRPGEFIAPDGTVCGVHRGVIHYTVGQRKHLGIALGRPVFVKRIDAKENRVYLADAGEECSARALIGAVTTPTGEPLPAGRMLAKIRSTAPLAEAWVRPLPGKRAQIRFARPQRAVAPGQSLVLYTPEEEIVAGGGFIESAQDETGDEA